MFMLLKYSINKWLTGANTVSMIASACGAKINMSEPVKYILAIPLYVMRH